MLDMGVCHLPGRGYGHGLASMGLDEKFAGIYWSWSFGVSNSGLGTGVNIWHGHSQLFALLLFIISYGGGEWSRCLICCLSTFCIKLLKTCFCPDLDWCLSCLYARYISGEVCLVYITLALTWYLRG